MKLKNRVALITGAGTGMGRATAELFAQEGATVVINYSRSKDAAEDVAARICAAGGKAIIIAADIANDTEVVAMTARIADEFGGLDVLVNNAGWSTRIPHYKLEDLSEEIWDRTLNTNLRGAFYCVRAAAPMLRQRPGSSIINVASVAGLTGMGSSIIYAASKGAMLTMTKSLARALAPEIRVNAIAPGLVRTKFANWPEAAFDMGDEITPLGKLPSVEDVARTALFLAADAMGITGETIVLDGGLNALGTVQLHSKQSS